MENQSSQQNFFNHQTGLPNATAVLVLGIISILGCACYGIVGLTCGIIALVLANKDMTRFSTSPELYTEASYKNLKAGRVCAIIGTILSAIYVIVIIFILATVGTEILKHPGSFSNHYS